MIVEALLGVMLAAPANGWTAPLSVARCPYEAPQLPAQAEIALDATLLVRTREGTGSAVIISPDGFALTAAHVVSDAETVEIVAHGGAKIEAHVVRVHEPQDIALLKLELEGPSSCLRPRAGPSPLGSDVFILGSPGGEELSFSVSKGIVSGYRSFDDVQFVQLDASVNPGNSGGPALDAEGGIVGIASWKISHISMEGLAFAVPADVALEALGVVIGEQSSSDWKDDPGHVAASSPTDSPTRAEPGSEPVFNPAQIRRDRLRRAFIITGSVLLGTGVTAVAATGGVYLGLDRMTQRGWQTLRGFNTASWALSIGGAAMLVTGLVIPKRVKDRTGLALSIQPGLRGVSLHGSF